MVKDRSNYYYTQLLMSLQDSYPTLKGGTVYNSTPPSFPYMYYKQLDAPTALTTLSGTEDGITLSAEIKIYSKKNINDARNIANVARACLVGKYFHIDMFKPVENVSDSSVYQFVIRCSKTET